MNDVFHSIDVTESVPDKNGDSDEEIAAVDADDTNLFLAVERNPPVQRIKWSKFGQGVQWPFTLTIWNCS